MNENFQLGEETCMKTCVLLWTWWSERNKANQGNHIRSLDEILFSYQLHLTEYCEVITRRKKLKRSTQQVWSPPPTDFLKINTDGAFVQSSCFGGWGFTIKNEHGETLVAGAGNLKMVADPLHAETAAMLHALQEAARMGCHKVILETDASTLKQAMTSNAIIQVWVFR